MALVWIHGPVLCNHLFAGVGVSRFCLIGDGLGGVFLLWAQRERHPEICAAVVQVFCAVSVGVVLLAHAWSVVLPVTPGQTGRPRRLSI